MVGSSLFSASSFTYYSHLYSHPHSHPHSQPNSQPHGEPYIKLYLDFETPKTLDPEAYIESAILDKLRNQQNQRFYDFRQDKISFRLHSAFTAGTHRRELPAEPLNYKQLAGYQFEKDFCQSMDEQFRQHREQFKSWDVVSSKEATGHQVLGCQWVFKYKTDKHNGLQKCKSRLVVCGNQQRQHNLPTRATTLAATYL